LNVFVLGLCLFTNGGYVFYEEYPRGDGDCDGFDSKLVVEVASVTDRTMKGVSI
jgi:hypothetical protein